MATLINRRRFLWRRIAIPIAILAILLASIIIQRSAEHRSQESLSSTGSNAPSVGQIEPAANQEVGAALNGAAQVRSMTTIKQFAGRLDWSPDGTTIVFDKIDPTGKYSIYTMKPDGSSETCLTCGKAGLSRHDGNPSYHPSGQYIVFQAEKEVHQGLSTFSTPGQGVHNDVWVMSADAKTIVQLTDLPRGHGVLHPHFSHDGTQLVWAEKIAPADDPAWALKVANFTVTGGTPAVSNIRTYQPLGSVFYESHGFSLDGSKIIFSAILKPDRKLNQWMDIYTLDLNTKQLVNLTNSPADWDEHAHYTPSGKRIVWIASNGCNCNPQRARDLQTDLWMMESDGSNKQRLTSLSDRRSPQFLQERSVAADSAWNPDGTRLALYVITDNGPPATGRIVVLDFTAPQ